MHYETPVQNFRRACQGLGLLSIEDFFLVHVHDVELVGAARKPSLSVRLALDSEVKPAAVAFRIRVGLQVQIEFARLHLDGQVEIAALEHRVERQLAGRSVWAGTTILVTVLQSTVIDWAARSVLVKATFDRLGLYGLGN